MSLSSTLSRIRTLNEDGAKIQKKIADITKDEAKASSKIADYSSRAARASSLSQAQSYSREVERAQKELSNLIQKRADEASKFARKQEEIVRAQNDLSRFQERQSRDQERTLSELQQTTRALLHRQMGEAKEKIGSAPAGDYHAFISHASEDKDELVRPLAKLLMDAGFRIWYDEMTLKLGDSLRRSIDQGLARSKFGIVVLSPSFFTKNWPQYELDGLVAREMVGGKVILPLWHRITKDEVMKISPSLADKLALNTSMYTIAQMAEEIGSVLKSE